MIQTLLQFSTLKAILLLFSCWIMFDSLQSHGLQHTNLPCPSLSLRVCSNSCPFSRRCHQPPYSLSHPSLPAFNLSQHQGLSQRVSSSHEVVKVLELQLHHQSFQDYSGLISFRIDFFDLLAGQGALKESSPASQLTSISSLALRLLYDPTLTSVHDTGKAIALTAQTWSAKWCLCLLICV